MKKVNLKSVAHLALTNVKVNIGIRLFFVALSLVTANIVGLLIAVFMPIGQETSPLLGIKLQLKKDGLKDDNLKFFNELEQRLSVVDEGLDSKQVVDAVKGLFKDMLKDDGTFKLNMKGLEDILGDADDKNILKIVQKQGEALKALEEGAAKGKKHAPFSEQLAQKMKDIEMVYKSREQGKEVRLNLKAAAIMTTDNTIEGNDTLPDDLIESFSIASFVPKRYPREYVFDLATRTTVANIDQFKVWYEEGDEEGAFAIVAEGALKPLVSYTLTKNYSEVSKVAAKYVVTEEFAKFRQNAYNIIRRLINQKILRDYAALLTTRLLADAAAYVASALDNQYAAPTDYHAVAAVAAQIESLDFMPDMLILNPQDKWRIGMLQDLNGQFYLTIPTTDPTGQTRMMGFIVRTSNRVPVGNFLLGEAGLWNIEDEAITVRTGYGVDVVGTNPVTSVTSDFDNNRFRVIVETFFHTWIGTNNQGSFVYANFAAVKALLQA